MPRPLSNPICFGFPPEPDPARLPRFADRKQLAAIHTQYFGPQSHRTLESWPLDWRRVNGRAVASVREFLAEAQRRFDEAPAIRPGQRQIVEHPTA